MSEQNLSAGTVSTEVRRALPRISEEAAVEVGRALRRLIDELQPRRIFVFGSQARGDADAGSDLDLMVVVPASAIASHQRAQVAYRAVGPHLVPMDIIVVTEAEFEARRSAVGSLPATVLREGLLVYAT